MSILDNPAKSLMYVCVLGAGLAAMTGGVAHGQTTVHTTRAAFTAAATGPLTRETLEDEVVGVKPSPTTLAGSLLGVAVTSGTADIQVRNTDPSSYGTVNTTPAGSKFMTFGYANQALGPFTAEFSRSTDMTAFGFDLSGYQGIENSTGGFTAALFNGGSQVDSVFVADTTSFTAHFRGITSTIPFDAIRFTFNNVGSNNADILAFDEIDFNQIPEPTGLALIGLAAGALLRRRPAV